MNRTVCPLALSSSLLQDYFKIPLLWGRHTCRRWDIFIFSRGDGWGWGQTICRSSCLSYYQTGDFLQWKLAKQDGAGSYEDIRVEITFACLPRTMKHVFEPVPISHHISWWHKLLSWSTKVTIDRWWCKCYSPQFQSVDSGMTSVVNGVDENQWLFVPSATFP